MKKLLALTLLIICINVYSQKYKVYSDETHTHGFTVYDKKIEKEYYYKDVAHIVDSINQLKGGGGWHLPSTQQATQLNNQMFGTYNTASEPSTQIKDTEKKILFVKKQCKDCANIDADIYWTNTFDSDIRDQFEMRKDSLPCSANFKSYTHFTISEPAFQDDGFRNDKRRIFLIKEF